MIILNDLPIPKGEQRDPVPSERCRSPLHNLELGQAAVFPKNKYKRQEVINKLINVRRNAPDKAFIMRTLNNTDGIFPAYVIWRTL